MENFNEDKNKLEAGFGYAAFLTHLNFVIEDKGFTYAQLAALLGMRYTNFRRLMLGKYDFPIKTLFRLFDILQVHPILAFDDLSNIKNFVLCEEEEDSAAVAVAGNLCSV